MDLSEVTPIKLMADLFAPAMIYGAGIYLPGPVSRWTGIAYVAETYELSYCFTSVR